MNRQLCNCVALSDGKSILTCNSTPLPLTLASNTGSANPDEVLKSTCLPSILTYEAYLESMIGLFNYVE